MCQDAELAVLTFYQATVSALVPTKPVVVILILIAEHYSNGIVVIRLNGGKRLFDRQPLIAHFTFLNGGEARNDLAIVGVHLASGQSWTTNHDRAMELLVEELRQARTDGDCIPLDENDILITGDFNANRFDNSREQFWVTMESNGWDVLVENGANYPATRLSWHPLGLHNSKLDYIIVTSTGQSLGGEEIQAQQSTIHTDLIWTDPVSFRRNASDHIPITVQVQAMDDTDQF